MRKVMDRIMVERVKGIRAAVLLTAVAGLLSGCGLGSFLGLDRASPDEFRVVSRAPLEVPPDYNLRPPQPGSPRPQELERDTRATSSMFGASASQGGLFDPRTSARQTQGEAALLSQAGAEQADPEIRSIVDRENPGVVVGDRSLIDRLLFWRDDQPAPQTVHQGAPPTIARTGSTQATPAPTAPAQGEAAQPPATGSEAPQGLPLNLPGSGR